MSSHDTHDLQKSVRRYLFGFYALIAGTVITVGAYYVHIPSVALTIAVAMFIASVKAFLVAGYLIKSHPFIQGLDFQLVDNFIFGFVRIYLCTVYRDKGAGIFRISGPSDGKSQGWDGLINSISAADAFSACSN